MRLFCPLARRPGPAYSPAVATVSRPGSGLDHLSSFADLQRQVAGRVAPLRTRQRRRVRARLRRLGVRIVLLVVPITVALLLALDTAGSRTWLGDRWDDIGRTASPGQQHQAPRPYSPGPG